MLGADRFVAQLSVDQQKVHATERYSKGISEIDMWNFDSYLADVIVAGCEWHLARGNTSPWHLEVSQWQAILTEIRDGFAERDALGIPNPPKSAWKALRRNFKYFWD